MMPSPDRARDRLEELFARYWDSTLTADEAEELVRMLREDPAEANRFSLLCLFAVTAVDRQEVFRAADRDEAGRRRPADQPRPARRARVGLAATAAAVLATAGLVFALLLARPGPVPPGHPGGTAALPGPVITQSFGTVRVGEADAGAGAIVAARSTIVTRGVGSAAVLRFPDGTDVVLAGDTTATLDGEGGRRVVLREGNVSAHVPPAGEPPAAPITLATPEAEAVPATAGTRLALGRFARRTEIGVVEGLVRLVRPNGDPLMNLAGGEVGTVDPKGEARKESRPRVPVDYAWDLTGRSPGLGVAVGRVALDAPRSVGGSLARAEFWDDPYTGRRTCQVRSENGWARGHCALYPDSRITARYRVDRRGPGQFLVVVRPATPTGPTSVVLEVPRPFEGARAGEWEVIDVRAADLQVEKGVLDFAPPWVVFLVIFNTYEDDLGLQVTDVRITRPDAPHLGR